MPMSLAAPWANSARSPPRPISSPRADQDAYAVETLTRARKAIETGAFKAEIVPVSVAGESEPRIVDTDEHPLKVSPEKIPLLKPALRGQWHHHGGQRLGECGWRRRAGSRQPLECRARGTCRCWPRSRACHAQPGAGLVHHGADPGDPQIARQDRMARRRCRSVRNQRSVCGRRHGRRQGSRHSA